jgi:hypothetical protein
MEKQKDFYFVLKVLKLHHLIDLEIVKIALLQLL